MKAQTITNMVEQSGTLQTHQFSIKATARSFEILSSGLYSDKVRAIVRELSCNAHDSHVAAGKGDRPIEVKLPSSLDQTFHVKDFGTGLSHEDVIQIYTTYFESTKTDSDDFIGQLGLGSKSPFSYAPTFTVESRFEGIRRVYTCFKNEQGMPAISLMGEDETSEENGITVALAVKRDDIEKFNDAARKVYMYFDPVPTVLGHRNFEPYRINHTIKGTNWKIRETEYNARMSGVYVVQGFVAYPVDSSIMHERNLSKAASKLLRTNLDLHVDIGMVEVAASREALSYDARTIDNLVKVLEAVAVEMRISFEREFTTCKTPWEVAQMIGKMTYNTNTEFRDIFESMHNASPFMWDGKPVRRAADLDLSTIATTVIRRQTLGHKGKVNSSGAWTPQNTSSKEMAYDISRDGTYILVDKEAKGHHEVVRQFLSTKRSEHGSPCVILIAPTSKKLYSQAEVDLLIEQLGSPPVVYADTLGIVRAKSSTYVKRVKEAKMRWTGFPSKKNRWGNTVTSDKFSRNCWSTEVIDLADGGFYIDVDRFEAQYNGVSQNSLDEVIENAKTLGLLANDVKLYGISMREHKHIEGISEWINIIDYLKTEFDKLNAGNRLFNRAIVDVVKNDLPNQVVNYFIVVPTYTAQLNDGSFKDMMTTIRTMNANAPTVSTSAVRSLARYLGFTDPTHQQSVVFETEWNRLKNRYGMLKIINWSAVEISSIDYVINYINAVDPVVVV